MATVASPKNGLSMASQYGARTGYDGPSSVAEENQPLGRAASVMSNSRAAHHLRAAPPATPTRKVSTRSQESRQAKKTNGASRAPTEEGEDDDGDDDDDIPENMYRPEKDDPDGWIHRDKLAKIESEELQAAGINLANARSRSHSRLKSVRSATGSDAGDRRDEKRQRLQSPAEIDDAGDRASWDVRLPEEIDADDAAATETASQMYSNPVLRKSGSKIPVMTSSPLPIPAERYERETPIARKRTASGTMSLEGGDLTIGKTRNASLSKSPDEDDTASSAVVSSKPGSPQKARPKSVALSSSAAPGTKKTSSTNPRKTSAPPRATPSPSQRPGTRSGEPDRPRTSYNAPEGDPPWLASMYKPDPRLPPDQQLIPTLAKKQMQAQWAAAGAVPKAYDKEFTPIDVHDQEDRAPARSPRRSPSPAQGHAGDETVSQSPAWGLKTTSSVRSTSGRPGTAGSLGGGYSTMPKVLSPPMRESSPKIGTGPTPTLGARSTTMPPPTRMQAQSLVVEEDEKVKRGCGCCIVM